MDHVLQLNNDLAIIRYHADRKRANYTYRYVVIMCTHLIDTLAQDMQLYTEYYKKLCDILDYTGMRSKCAEYYKFYSKCSNDFKEWRRTYDS